MVHDKKILRRSMSSLTLKDVRKLPGTFCIFLNRWMRHGYV